MFVFDYKVFFAICGSLLAFVIAFYALVARERKSPYIVNSIHQSVLTVLVVLAVAIAAVLLGIENRVGSSLYQVAHLLLFLGVSLILAKVLNIFNRQVNLRDDKPIRNLAAIRAIKNKIRDLRSKPQYEHQSKTLSDDLVTQLGRSEIFSLAEKSFKLSDVIDSNGSCSIALVTRTNRSVDRNLVSLISTFLAGGGLFQYTVADRHPISLVSALKSDLGNKWDDIASNVYAVDAFTPHFGFTDSIYYVQRKKLTQTYGIKLIISEPTFAGIHTSTARAFNMAKKASSDQIRRPTLLVYEGLSALIDLESLEQYVIFIRHLIPSEKLWGGMLTVVCEKPGPNHKPHVEAVLNQYVDLKLDDQQ